MTSLSDSCLYLLRYHNVGDANRLKDHAEVYMPNSLRYILLDEDTRAKLPHPLTYEEVRAYSNSVHGVADHPHYHEEHPCNRTADAARVRRLFRPATSTEFEPSSLAPCVPSTMFFFNHPRVVLIES